MRIRTIKPEFFKHDKLGELPAMARLLFISLWCLADRRGRMEDRPKRIKAECLPYDDCDVDGLLQALNDAGFICRYEVDGLRVIEIESFEKHQRITGKEAETESELPGKQWGSNGETSGSAPVVQERKGKERKGEERKVFDPGMFDEMIPEQFAGNQTFLECWHDWVSSRHERKKPISERAARQQMRILQGFGVSSVAVESIRQSIAHDWQGLFMPKQNGFAPVRPPPIIDAQQIDTSGMTADLMAAAARF